MTASVLSVRMRAMRIKAHTYLKIHLGHFLRDDKFGLGVSDLVWNVEHLAARFAMNRVQIVALQPACRAAKPYFWGTE